MDSNINSNINNEIMEDFLCMNDEYESEHVENVENEFDKQIKSKINKADKYVTDKIIYENKEVYSLEGELIGYIPVKRFNWYIKKGLCTIINENSIKLNFEPTYKNEKNVIDKDTQGPKENICVVCGCDQKLKRFRVIPYEIKKCFPDKYKAHMSSDVVVICSEHAADGDYYNRELKYKLYEDNGVNPDDFKIDSKMRSIYTLIKKIEKDDNICKNQYTAKTLQDYFGKDPTIEDMNKLIDDVDNFKFNGFRTPEELLVHKIIEGNKVNSFIQDWKQNFVDSFDPAFLQWDFWNNGVQY